MKENLCENCGIDFKRQYVRRFCSKVCWYKWNGKNLASFNDERFQWSEATEEEKIERLKIRFEKYVIKKDGCWDWNGYLDKDGYTLLNSGANGKGFKERRGHRISWIINNGDIPEGKYVCHKCDNPRCTNPEHLFLGDTLENNRDKVKKGRGNNGEKHGNSKFTNEMILEVRKMYDDGIKISKIMEKFSMCRTNVHDIGKRKIWKHI